MQGIRQAVLDARVRSCQCARRRQPVGAVGDVGPGPDMGDARRSGCRCRHRCGRAARPGAATQSSAAGRRRPAGAKMRASRRSVRRRLTSCGSPGSGRPPRAGARASRAAGQPGDLRVAAEHLQRGVVVGLPARAARPAWRRRSARRSAASSDAEGRARRCASSSVRSVGEAVALDARSTICRVEARRRSGWCRRCRRCMWRPARPAIWASSAGQRSAARGRRTCAGRRRRRGATSMLRPMPMASVATM